MRTIEAPKFRGFFVRSESSQFDCRNSRNFAYFGKIRLQFFCTVLYGLTKHLLNRLRLIQNTAARIVTLSKRFDHITPILLKLHWLPLNYRIHFKILLLVYKCLNGLGPTFLCELSRYTNGPRLLRSSSQNFLAVPRTRLKTYDDGAFSAAVPRLWNQLPPELRGVTSVDQFRTQLKTYLFKLA